MLASCSSIGVSATRRERVFSVKYVPLIDSERGDHRNQTVKQMQCFSVTIVLLNIVMLTLLKQKRMSLPQMNHKPKMHLKHLLHRKCFY